MTSYTIEKDIIENWFHSNSIEDNVALLWLKVKTYKNKFTYICGYYQQWAISRNKYFKFRFNPKPNWNFIKFADKVNNLRAGHGEVKFWYLVTLILTCQKIKISGCDQNFESFFPIYEDMLNDNDLVIVNKDKTRFLVECDPYLLTT